ncbi:hypothetical protein [Mycoplasma sp. ATU-Cv-703]|uniref:hypothetical protein n=1 Tax=Mycoplasma sp. ATU-Cv-703 TaxID=2498595 RepID=UPI000FDE3235
MYRFNKHITRTIHALVALALVAIRIIETFRSVTHWPHVSLDLTSDEIDALQSLNVRDIFGAFGSQFVYFTIITNFIFVVTLALSWIGHVKINSYWKTAVMVYLSVTGIVFFLFIAPMVKWGQSAYFDFTLIHEHLIVVLVGIWWFAVTPGATPNLKLEWRKSLTVTMVIPLFYMAFTIGLYAATQGNVAVYAFLNFLNVFNLKLPVAYSLLISITLALVTILSFVGLAFAWYKLQNIQARQMDEIFV